MKYIQLGRTVTSLKVTEDQESRFKIQHIPTIIKEGDTEEVEYFDYVLVCNGHFTLPNVPDFEGRKEFEGTQFHMHELRKMESKDFDNKNILIVGA